MNLHSEIPFETQPVSSLPLFSWRPTARHPDTRAGDYVARRFRVQPELADLIAALAGLGSEVRQ